MVEAVDAAVGHCAPAAARWRGGVVQLSNRGTIGGHSAIGAGAARNACEELVELDLRCLCSSRCHASIRPANLAAQAQVRGAAQRDEVIMAATSAMPRVSIAFAGRLLHVRELTDLSAIAEECSSVWQQRQVAHLRGRTLLMALLCGAHTFLRGVERAASGAIQT